MANQAKRWTEAKARQLIEEWEESGESLAGFARERGLHPQRLAWWRKRLRPSEWAPASVATRLAPSTLVPVSVRGAAVERAAAATVELGDAVRIELGVLDGASAKWVAALARALGCAR
jgi:transposase-like protein